MEDTILLSELLAKAKHDDFIGEPMIIDENENPVKTITPKGSFTIRLHEMPSYGYFPKEFEDTREWYDCWWHRFCTIEDGVVHNMYAKNGSRIEFDI